MARIVNKLAQLRDNLDALKETRKSLIDEATADVTRDIINCKEEIESYAAQLTREAAEVGQIELRLAVKKDGG